MTIVRTNGLRARAQRGDDASSGRLASTERRRMEILEAALERFTTVGYEGTSMEQIRSDTGASIGSIYHHFTSKEELAGALSVEGLRDYQQGLLRELGRQSGAEACVRGAVDYHLRWVARRPAMARWLFQMRAAESAEVVRASVRALNRAALPRFFALLDRFVERGEILRFPRMVLVAILLGPSQDFARHWLEKPVRAAMSAARVHLGNAAWASLRGPNARGPS